MKEITINHEVEQLTKVLSSTLSKEFDFVENIKDVKWIERAFYQELKLKIVIDKRWAAENFSRESLEYIEQDYQSSGYAHIGPFFFTTCVYDDDINEKVIFVILQVMSFFGHKLKEDEVTLSYIIE